MSTAETVATARSGALACELLDLEAAIERGDLLERWSALRRHHRDANDVFSSCAWMGHLAKGQSEEVRVAVFEDDDGIVGLLPLIDTVFSLDFTVGRRHLLSRRLPALRAQGSGLVGAAGPGTVLRCLRLLAEELRRGDVLVLPTVPRSSPTWEALCALQAEGGLRCALTTGERPWWLLELPASYEDYMARFSGKSRSTLRRFERRLERQLYEVELVRFRRAEQAPELVEAIRTIESNTWQSQALGERLAYLTRDDRAASDLARRGMLDGWVLYGSGDPLAFVFGYRHGSTFYLAETGFDARFSKLSPGRVLVLKIIADLIDDEEISTVNFGIGHAEYKGFFGNVELRDGGWVLYRPSLRVDVWMGLERLLDRASAMGKALRSPTPSPGELSDVAASGNPAPQEATSSSGYRSLRIVCITTMYPTPTAPLDGLFVQRRIEALARKAEVVALAPVPWFPLVSRLVPRYRSRRGIPRRVQHEGYRVEYVRYLSVPRYLKPFDGVFLTLSLLWSLWRLRRRRFDPDVLDCHLAYPDGFAGVILGRRFGAAVTVTLRGHDINELPRYPVRGRQVRFALRRADRVFSVAEALAEGAVELGAPRERTIVAPNGIDTSRFRPGDRSQARRELGLPNDRRIVLSIGYLVERKGFQHLLRALPLLPRPLSEEVLVVIIGGPGGEAYVKPELDRLIAEHSLESQVRFVAPRPNEELPLWYRACDVFALMSSKEGRPNVVIEALACGRPVVTTRAWGNPELVSSEAVGLLVSSPPPPAETAQAIVSALGRNWDESTIAASVAGRSWEAVAEQILGEMSALVEVAPDGE